jgi:PAS domain S-box-containing protein
MNKPSDLLEDRNAQRERMLASLVANLPGILYRCHNTESRTMEFISDGCAELLGYAPEDLIEDRITSYGDLIHPHDREMAWSALQEGVGQQRVYRCSYRVTAAGDQVKWVWEQGSGVFSDTGEVLALEGFITDVTNCRLAEDAMADSDEQASLLIESIQDGVFVIQDERLAFVNTAFARMLGYTVAEVIGQDFRKFIAPEDVEMVAGYDARQQAGEDVPAEYEWRLLHKDGMTRVFVNMNVVLMNYLGRRASLGTVKDITEHKRVEEEKVRLLERVQRQHSTVIRLSTRPSVAEGRLSEALPAIIEAAAKALEVARVVVLRRTPDGEAYRCVEAFALAAGRQACRSVIHVAQYRRYFDAMREGQVMDIVDVTTDPRTAALTEAYWAPLNITSVLNAPVRMHGQVVGAVHFEHSGNPRAWAPDEVAFAGQIADVVAQTFLNADIRRKADELAVITRVSRDIASALDLQQVLTFIAQHAAELSGSDMSGVFALQSDGRHVFARHGLTDSVVRAVITAMPSLLSGGPISRAISARHPVQVPDIDDEPDAVVRGLAAMEGIRAILVAPMLEADNEVSGGIVLAQRYPRVYEPEEIAFIQALAQQSSQAVENARLLGAERSARRRTEALYKVARALIASEGLPDLLKTIVETVAEILGVDLVTLILLDLERRQVIDFVNGGARQHLVDMISFEDLWEGLTGWVLREGKPALSRKDVPDPRESPKVQQARVAVGIGSVIVVPLRYRETMLGTLTAVKHPEQPDFTERDLELLSAMANQAAAALENAHLLVSLSREKARLESLYRLGQHLSASLDIDNVTQRALTEICAALEARRGFIMVSWPDAYDLQLVAAVGFHGETTAAFGQDFHPGTGLTGWVVQHRQPALIDDVTQDSRWLMVQGKDDDVRSALSVPLLSGDELVGALTLSHENVAFFNEEHLRFAESAAATIAIAIKNARLFGKSEQRAREQEQVSNIVRALNDLDVKQAFPVLADGVEALTQCDRVSLALLDENSERFNVFVLKSSVRVLEEGETLLISETAMGKNIIAGQIHLTADLSAEIESPVARKLYEAGMHSRISVPLQAAGRVIGVLNLASRRTGCFTEAQVPILRQIADALAIAVENSRLFQAERRQRELAERLQETALLVNTLDLQEVLTLILDQLGRVFPYESGSIQILEQDALRVIAERNLAPSGIGQRYLLDKGGSPPRRSVTCGQTSACRCGCGIGSSAL